MAVTAGTLPTHGPLFVILLIGTVVLVGLLNYVPALALGPVVEHFMLWYAEVTPGSHNIGTPHDNRKHLLAVRPCAGQAGHRLGVRQAGSARAVAQSGDVRRLRRQHPHDHPAGLQALGGQGEAPPGFILAIALWLWFTVLFANFAEALAEGRSKAQAASLRGMKKKTIAKKLEKPVHGSSVAPAEADELRKGAWCWSRPAT